MSKAEASVDELVSMIERGELRLPEMQRRYVWRATRVRDLLDSLYRGYPSGSILMWQSDIEVPLREFAVTQAVNPYQSTKLLLDGQQRLTSLSAVIRGNQISVRGRKKPIDLLFNLEHPDILEIVTEVNENSDTDVDQEDEAADASDDEIQSRLDKMTFVVATKKLARLPHWIPVTQVFRTDNDAPFLKKAGVNGFEDPRYQKYVERLTRLRRIKGYVYRMDVLERHLSYEEVTEIFVRVNSLGAKLRGSDLAMAQITAKWQQSLVEFEKFQKECTHLGYDMEIGGHIRNLVAFATGQSRFHTVTGIDLERLRTAWGKAKDGARYAINFLKSNVGIENLTLLSSPYFIVSLGFFGAKQVYKLTAEQESKLRYWLLVASTKGRYSRGSSETMLDQDLTAIAKGAGLDGMLDNVRQQFGRLSIEPGDLQGRNQRSAYFKTKFLAFREAGAKDWETRLAISLQHTGYQHKLEFHHVFPKGVLKSIYEAREINDIANLAFISSKTNRKISKKEPAKYLSNYVEAQGEDSFTAQCIPLGDSYLQVTQYKEFLGVRRALVAKRLNEYIGTDNE